MTQEQWQIEIEAHSIAGDEAAIAELFAKAPTIELHDVSARVEGGVVKVVATDALIARDRA